VPAYTTSAPLTRDTTIAPGKLRELPEVPEEVCATVSVDRTNPRVLVSCSADYISAASTELRNKFGANLAVERVGVDMLAIDKDGLTVADVAKACRTVPLIFPRHLTVEQLQTSNSETDYLAEVAVALARNMLTSRELAIQAWSSGTLQPGSEPARVSRSLTSVLEENGYKVVRAGTEAVLSCYITPARVILGFNRAEYSLSDWPGGRVRLARSPEQISRAEFKLEELFKLYPVKLKSSQTCLDLGAAPGGWTRIIRKMGPEVYSVDPATLDSGLTADPGVHYVQATAHEFLRSTRRMFDIVVNDMRMSAGLSSQVMLDAAQNLHPGGLAILTLKIGRHNVLRLISKCMRLLNGKYELVFIRHLHHNRLEITVLMRRR
jgi:23S rRNA (cytidine2498-2'-O)-methyltransferase